MKSFGQNPTHTAVITDTDSSLPAGLASHYGIHQVPITIQFGEDSYETGVNLDDLRLFERIDREKRLPTTAAPSPGQFTRAFQAAFDGGAENILCFCVSSAISATYNNAVLAAQEGFEGHSIHIVDTQTLSMAQGYMALAACEALQTGASVAEALEVARREGEKSHLYAALSTLKYLAMSGRVGQLAAGFAGLLDVKPILSPHNGKLEMLERVRTRGKSLARVLELLKSAAEGKTITRMSIVHVNALEEAHTFEKQLRQELACPDEIIFAELTPGLSVHSGAGLLGVTMIA